jgi:hypothetical protein
MADERLTALFTGIGDAIRGKEGSADPIPAQEMGDRVRNLPSGGMPAITVMLSNNGETLQWYDTAKGAFVSIGLAKVETTIGENVVVYNSSGETVRHEPVMIYLLRSGHEEQECITVLPVYASFGATRSETWVYNLPAMCAAAGGDFSASDWKYITEIVFRIWDS